MTSHFSKTLLASKTSLASKMLLAACLASFGAAAQAAPLRCEPGMVERMRMAVAAASAPRGVFYLTDDKAERFLTFLNFNFGRQMDNWAQAVIVHHYPAYGFDDVSFVNNDCISGTLRLQARATRVALEAAENPFPVFP